MSEWLKDRLKKEKEIKNIYGNYNIYVYSEEDFNSLKLKGEENEYIWNDPDPRTTTRKVIEIFDDKCMLVQETRNYHLKDSENSTYLIFNNKYLEL